MQFDKPFDKLTVLIRVEGLTVLSKVEGLTAMSKADGRRCASSLVTAVCWYAPNTPQDQGNDLFWSNLSPAYCAQGQ